MSDSDDEEEELDQDESGDDEGESDDEEGAPKRKLSGKKLILFVGAPVLVIVIAVVALFLTGIVDLGGSGEAVEEDAAAEEEEGPPKEVVFFDLPEMLVNLNSSGRQTNYLKLTVSLEIDDPLAVERLEKLLPRIVDNFQVYLRELRVEDLSGSAGVYRLKEELLARVNAAVEPINVTDVLFLPIRLSPTPTICSVSPWTAGKGRRRRIEEAIRLILDCSENRTGV